MTDHPTEPPEGAEKSTRGRDGAQLRRSGGRAVAAPWMGLGVQGKALWRKLSPQTAPARHPLLLNTCRLVDRLEWLHTEIEADGDPRLMTEARNTTLALRSLLADLAPADAGRPSRDGSKLDQLAERRRHRDAGA